jgi:hypothetical protein
MAALIQNSEQSKILANGKTGWTASSIKDLNVIRVSLLELPGP